MSVAKLIQNFEGIRNRYMGGTKYRRGKKRLVVTKIKISGKFH